MIHQTASVSFVGNGTHTLDGKLRGVIKAIKVVADSDITNSWDIAITGTTTGIEVLTDTSVDNNATTWFFPRHLATLATAGTAGTDAFVEIPVVNETLTIVASNAGTSGTVTVTVIYASDN